jgi:membrane-bound lytic murein transglycosylase B
LRLRFTVCCLLALANTLPALAAEDADFAACARGLGDRAIAAGVNETLVDAVIADLSPLERVIALDRKQPEFVQTFAEYLATRVTEARVNEGRRLLEQHRSFLNSLLEEYGVPPRYLVAFWGLETNYGSYLGKIPTFDALATLACDPRRSDFFAGEFVDALKLAQRESLPPKKLKGSWAGAVGHTQFMPSSYLRYAVDGDGDGQIDLWGSERDALASGANFLRGLGWQSGERWGRQVRLPEGFPYELTGLQPPKTLAFWAEQGVTRLDGGQLPALDLEASILLPAGHRGLAFMVYENFRVAMRWNQSQSYALSVGLLADQLVDMPPLKDTVFHEQTLAKADLETAQAKLNALGYAAGEPDGILGSRTRAALRAFQLDNALPADAYPDPTTLAALKAHALP